MLANLPSNTQELLRWTWAEIEPYYRELDARPLRAGNLPAWLGDWSDLSARLDELYYRLYTATTTNTVDAQAKQRYNAYLDEIFPAARAAENTLKKKLIESQLVEPGFEIPLRNMRTEAAIFRSENLPLLSQEQKLVNEYEEIVGAQTATWEGREVTLTQLRPYGLSLDRAQREAAWRLAADRRLQDRDAINRLWQKFLPLRLKIAENAGMSDYRAYRWKQLLRFDYTPQDSQRFHQAIAEAVVPAASRRYEKRRQLLGVETLRPWDLDVDPFGRPPLKPFEDVETLVEKSRTIFHRLDPQLGAYFDILAAENLLDLENRKNKAPGAYSIPFSATRRPFIFANAVGLVDDVQTLFHESGHAFHSFEAFRLPYFHQMNAPMEFSEVASMGMELLASPYLAEKSGGFFDEAGSARARSEHLESILLFWPYMAVVDAFQHWVYENPQKALDPARCDACWTELWQRYMPGVDWTGFEAALETGWHNKLHIHCEPFYYIEYGLAQLGAVQVWRNSLEDPQSAVTAYRRALALGGTAPLPALFEAAGARLAFDAGTLGEAVFLLESTIAKLEA